MNERQQKITELAQAIGLDVKEIFLNLRDPNVIPENGWVLQFKDGYFTPSMRKILRSNNLEINLENDPNLAIRKIDEAVNFQRAGLYRIVPIFNWSIDATNSDINVRGFFDGQPLTIANSQKVFKKEGKDAAGNDGDGRGTSQIDDFVGAYYVQVNTIGSKTIQLEFYPDIDGVEAAMWEASILIEEIFI